MNLLAVLISHFRPARGTRVGPQDDAVLEGDACDGGAGFHGLRGKKGGREGGREGGRVSAWSIGHTASVLLLRSHPARALCQLAVLTCPPSLLPSLPPSLPPSRTEGKCRVFSVGKEAFLA